MSALEGSETGTVRTIDDTLVTFPLTYPVSATVSMNDVNDPDCHPGLRITRGNVAFKRAPCAVVIGLPYRLSCAALSGLNAAAKHPLQGDTPVNPPMVYVTNGSAVTPTIGTDSNSYQRLNADPTAGGVVGTNQAGGGSPGIPMKPLKYDPVTTPVT